MIDLKCIILPTDFSECAAEAVRYACALTDRFHAELHVLHVIRDVSSQLPDFGMGLSIPALRESFGARHDQLEKAALEKLARVLPAGWEQGKRVVLATRFGNPFVEVIRYARQHHAGLIVMGTHGRSALPHALIGSVAEKVVRKAPCPVLSVRPAAQAFAPPVVDEAKAERRHNPKTVIRHAIVELYGPCPVNDFEAANAWASGIDWEHVKSAVDRDHPGFPWKHDERSEHEAAELMIFDVRHDMLREAGRKG